jgi:hypothetical protein
MHLIINGGYSRPTICNKTHQPTTGGHSSRQHALSVCAINLDCFETNVGHFSISNFEERTERDYSDKQDDGIISLLASAFVLVSSALYDLIHPNKSSYRTPPILL